MSDATRRGFIGTVLALVGCKPKPKSILDGLAASAAPLRPFKTGTMNEVLGAKTGLASFPTYPIHASGRMWEFPLSPADRCIIGNISANKVGYMNPEFLNTPPLPRCSSCGGPIHYGQSIDYMGECMCHRNRSDCRYWFEEQQRLALLWMERNDYV